MSKDFDRKFDTWQWYDSEEATTGSFTFEVRITRPENVALGPIGYYIKSEDPPIFIKAASLDDLREKLDKKVRSWLSVEWRPKLLVIVKHKDAAEGKSSSTSLNLEVTQFDEGKASRDDSTWHRVPDRFGHGIHVHRGALEDARSTGTEDDWDSTHFGNPKSEAALAHEAARKARRRVVDDTPANRLALQAIQAGIVQLAQRLDTLLSANTIQDTLKNVNVGRLLSVEGEPS